MTKGPARKESGIRASRTNTPAVCPSALQINAGCKRSNTRAGKCTLETCGCAAAPLSTTWFPHWTMQHFKAPYTVWMRGGGWGRASISIWRSQDESAGSISPALPSCLYFVRTTSKDILIVKAITDVFFFFLHSSASLLLPLFQENQVLMPSTSAWTEPQQNCCCSNPSTENSIAGLTWSLRWEAHDITHLSTLHQRYLLAFYKSPNNVTF